MRVLVGGVGYRNLRDYSLGPHVTDLLAEQAADGVEVEDLSYGPVQITHNLKDRAPYDRLVLVGAVSRGRPPGNVKRYRWNGALPAPEEVQARVAEAVTGVISLDNVLVVCGALGGLPGDVRVVEVEPADEGWGEGLSDAVASNLPEVIEAVWSSTRP
jgi:hydrogenase maturation protease